MPNVIVPLHIAVDLSYARLGGSVGGAYIHAKELLKTLCEIAPEHRYFLICSPEVYQDLSLPVANTQYIEIPSSDSTILDNVLHQIKILLRDTLNLILPQTISYFVRDRYRQIRFGYKTFPDNFSPLVKNLGAHILFCPFTHPRFYHPAVPTISLVHDVQHLAYPQFFTIDEIAIYDRAFRESCRHANYIVSVSDFTRREVLANSELSDDQVVTIHTCGANRFNSSPSMVVEKESFSLRMPSSPFLLYPANYWLHKNHEMLFAAFSLYHSRNPQSDLKIVLTGAKSDRETTLIETIRKMGLSDKVVFAGYLADDDFAELMRRCDAVIFPSLYEGFGMPILEAMRLGKPILCSNTSSLPEVAGDAALYFDPRRPDEIAMAIERITTDSILVANLIKKGSRHVIPFSDSNQMAREYLKLFENVIAIHENRNQPL